MSKVGSEYDGRSEGLVLLLAVGFDLLGEPPARFHPVVWYGKLIRMLERRAPHSNNARLLYGVWMLLVACTIVLVIVSLFQRFTQGLAGLTQRWGE
ncbi:cobalamin biosynthesis protein [Ktedonospora formicarum]|uniref:Cobalamin biosynthesis protein CobD n=1 Tax=Ktedonospora formicarum TaxID=2778364 RepID=A0A8J3MVD1_9CHLR|nr:cobalamin biosynthesis protein [Ktedonospora formicarum]GHO46400.1 hypothetical protein KSX_45630 [Ktedonospora formicarum]